MEKQTGASTIQKKKRSMIEKFSANLGFLWRDRPFPERIRKASEAGFQAVEFHDQAQEADLPVLKQQLDQADLTLVSLNTRMGETAGCAAIPGKTKEAHHDLEEAEAAADFLEANAIHIVAGKTDAPEALATYIENLQFALEHSKRTILIEPISQAAMPGYFLNSLSQAISIIERLDHPRLKLLFDCYHLSQEMDDLASCFRAHTQHVGHVQIASHPARQEPVDGEIVFTELLPNMIASGYSGFFGCEYTPRSSVEAGLAWRDSFVDV